MEREPQVTEEIFDVPYTDSLEPSPDDLTEIESEKDFELVEAESESESESTNKSQQCAHHWMVGLPVDAVCFGQCKNCGAGREFRDPNSEVKWKTHSKREYKRTWGTTGRISS